MSDAPAEECDFPYYDGRPAALSARRWLVVLAFTAAGFLALQGVQIADPGLIGQYTAVALFVLMPLVGLRVAAGRAWKAAFRRPTQRDLLIGAAFALLTLIVSGAVALLMMQVSVTAANPAVELLENKRGLELAAFLAATAPQLFGEELVTVVPFLACLSLLSRGAGLPRKAAIAGAWLVSALIFGALHLPTYQWHLGQALLVIGSARLVLTAPYLITKSVWASFAAHLTHDWSLFAIVIATSALRAN